MVAQDSMVVYSTGAYKGTDMVESQKLLINYMELSKEKVRYMNLLISNQGLPAKR
jgi:hypothetical protein